MNEAAKEARRVYQREWQRKNRDKVRQYQQDYWNRKAQQAAESEPAEAAQEDPAQEG